MSFLQKPIFWVGIVGLGVAGWALTGSEPSAAKPIVKKPLARKPASKKKIEFEKEDFTAKFAPVNITVKNAFKPIVARKGGIGSGEGSANSIPAELAGGDAGWFYTGNVEIDGVPSALLENRTTGDGSFVKRGQRWRNCAVMQISKDSIVLRGPTGDVTLVLGSEKPIGAPRVAPMPVTVPPALQGRIGGLNGAGGDRGMVQLPAVTMPLGGGVQQDGGGAPPIVIVPGGGFGG